MSISKIALAIPLSLGIACSTTGAQSGHTGAMWPLYEPSDGSMSSDRPARGTGATVATPSVDPGGGQDGISAQPAAGSTDLTTVAASGSTESPGSTGSSGSSGSMGSSGSAGPSDTSGSSGSTGSSDTQGSSGSMGSSDQSPSSGAQGSGGAMGSTDQGSASGSQGSASGPGDVKGHADDQTVRGKLSKVSKEEISITPKDGEAKTLKISPQTIVMINGKDSKPAQLKQGQQVRASYQSQDGEDVAVKIQVGKAAARKGKASGQMKGGGADHSGHGHGGSMGSMGGTGGQAGGTR